MGYCEEWGCTSCGKKVCCFDCENKENCNEKCKSIDKDACGSYVEEVDISIQWVTVIQRSADGFESLNAMGSTPSVQGAKLRIINFL